MLGCGPLSGWPIKWIGSRGGYLRLYFSVSNGVSHVEAWFTTASYVEEVLWDVRDGQLHVLVVDAIKSFDRVARSILDSALGRLGLPHWFRKVTSFSG